MKLKAPSTRAVKLSYVTTLVLSLFVGAIQPAMACHQEPCSSPIHKIKKPFRAETSAIETLQIAAWYDKPVRRRTPTAVAAVRG